MFPDRVRFNGEPVDCGKRARAFFNVIVSEPRFFCHSRKGHLRDTQMVTLKRLATIIYYYNVFIFFEEAGSPSLPGPGPNGCPNPTSVVLSETPNKCSRFIFFRFFLELQNIAKLQMCASLD